MAPRRTAPVPVGPTLLLTALVLAGCAGSPPPNGARGQDAYTVVPATRPDAVAAPYRIVAADRLNVTVFREPDLSIREVPVDASGEVLMPLIGAVPAQGRTVAELSDDIARRYTGRYLTNARVTVAVAAAASETVTVQGAVQQPGIYDIRGRTTLLDALALARGATNTAKLREVVVFRDIDGVRNAAVFDVAGIQSGRYADPELHGKDMIVVGFSGLRSAWRDLLSAVPIIAIFRPFQ